MTLLLILGPALVFGFTDKPTEMTISILGGSIAAAFLNIEKFRKIKGAGFEAEIKEAVEKAYATVDAVKTLAKPLILATMDILTKAGRWGGMDAAMKHKFMNDLQITAKSLDLKDSALEEAKIGSAEKRFCSI